MNWRRFWLVFGALLIANIVITNVIEAVSQPASVTIP